MITICNYSTQNSLGVFIETIGTKDTISTTTPTTKITTPPIFKVFQFLLKLCPSQVKERSENNGKTRLPYARESCLPIAIICSILNICPKLVQIKYKNSGMMPLHYIACDNIVTTDNKYHQEQNQSLFAFNY